jgi:hypothetical protein
MNVTRTHVAATMAFATALIGAGAPAANAAPKPTRTTVDGPTLNGNKPDISRSRCIYTRSPTLDVYQSNSKHFDCFSGIGGESVTIYNVDYVNTGGYGTRFVLENYNGTYTECSESYPNENVYASECGATNNRATMTYLSMSSGVG